MVDADVSDAQREELQILLDSVPVPLEPLDVSMLDGFLCAVLVQPSPVPAAQWLPRVTDVDARPLPDHFDATRLQKLAALRHRQLDTAIARREWFDPWVFELDPEVLMRADAVGRPPPALDEAGLDAVYPWVAGFAAGLNAFPALMALPATALTEPLALLYRHLDPDDLEDADRLLDAIAALPDVADLAEAVQDLVRATLLLADVGRPLPRAPGQPSAARRPPRPSGAPRRGRPKR
jgi:uncharacterized protein